MSTGTRRPRVLVISLGRRGGTTQYGWLMARGLAQQCDIATISSVAAENRARWVEIDGPHLEVSTFSSVVTMLYSFLNVARFARIRRFAREFAPDVVYYPHGHVWKPVLDLILPRSAKIVLTVHDPELHYGEDSLLHRALDAANRLRVDGYVLLNQSQRDAFISRLRLDSAKVRVIPIGVFDDVVTNRKALADLSGLEAVAPFSGSYALFVGRVQPYKGIDSLLRAFALVRDAPPLVIAGAGSLSERENEALNILRGRSENSVVFINRWLSNTEMASLVSAARFVVLPYTSATQSGVIPLASAFGIPAIASNIGGIAEQIVDGETGLLFPAGNDAALGAALKRAFEMNGEEYQRMSARCEAYARDHWAWDGLAEQLVGFFDALK